MFSFPQKVLQIISRDYEMTWRTARGKQENICCSSILLAPLPKIAFLCLGIAVLLLMMLFPLVLHPNKSYLEKIEQSSKIAHKRYLLCSLRFLCVAGFKYINLSHALAFALASSVFSGVVAIFLGRKLRKANSN